ncbi:MAG: biotin--[acetyl-CoA-carboxylase] ligase [Thermodesulfobacteriota bacterium]
MTASSALLRLLHMEKPGLPLEALCARLGLDRETVTELIRELSGRGHDIQAGPGGYCLAAPEDSLFPWEFPGREHRMHCYPVAESTMDIARRLARDGCPDFTAVTADRQHKGRGRLGRVWLSDPGGLYLTIIARPRMAPQFAFRVNFAASAVLARLLRQLYNLPAEVKWPNDILIQGRKISGMLSELGLEAGGIAFLNIGIGINVNNDPTPDEPRATSIRKETGHSVPRRRLLAAFLDALETKLRGDDLAGIIDEWKSMAMTIGKPVRIVTATDQYSGLAVDVDQNGALILESPDGSRRAIHYGDCFPLPDQGPDHA